MRNAYNSQSSNGELHRVKHSKAVLYCALLKQREAEDKFVSPNECTCSKYIKTYKLLSGKVDFRKTEANVLMFCNSLHKIGEQIRMKKKFPDWQLSIVVDRRTMALCFQDK